MGFNLPALWRREKFYSFSYPITNVASVHGTKSVQLDLKKYLSGDTDFVNAFLVRVSGNIVVAGAGVGTATGKDNPRALLYSANLSTAPIYGNCAPINQVSQRALDVDAGVNGDSDYLGSAALTDAAGTQAFDQTYIIRFGQTGRVVQGVGYDLALARYSSLTFSLTFGGRDQLFSGGTNTWDLSGLSVDLMALIDVGIQPQFIHAHEMFENIYNITASSTDFKIDNLPSGFIYSDLYIITEDANQAKKGILNNIGLQNGAQVWLRKGDSNAELVRRKGLSFPGMWRSAFKGSAAAQGDGQYVLPLHDGMFSRGIDCRNSPPLISVDVTSLSATTQLRVIGRKIIPGGIYQNPNAKPGKRNG